MNPIINNTGLILDLISEKESLQFSPITYAILYPESNIWNDINIVAFTRRKLRAFKQPNFSICSPPYLHCSFYRLFVYPLSYYRRNPQKPYKAKKDRVTVDSSPAILLHF